MCPPPPTNLHQSSLPALLSAGVICSVARALEQHVYGTHNKRGLSLLGQLGKVPPAPLDKQARVKPPDVACQSLLQERALRSGLGNGKAAAHMGMSSLCGAGQEFQQLTEPNEPSGAQPSCGATRDKWMKLEPEPDEIDSDEHSEAGSTVWI